MREFLREVLIEADAPRIWDVMARMDEWPQRISSFRSIVALDSAPVGVGSRFRVEQPRLPPSVMTVTAWGPGRGFAWASTTPLLWAVGEHWIASRGNTSVVTLRLRFDGLLSPLAGSLMRSLVERYMALEAAGLKSWAEEAQ